MTETMKLSYFMWLTLLSILSIFLTTTTHPVTMIILMLIYNIILCFSMNLWKSSTLFPIMFFMITISGLLIIFLYFSSLISNEKTINVFKNSMLFTLMINFLYFLSTNNYFYKSPHSLSSTNQMNFIEMNLMYKTPSITLTYQSPLNNMTMISMIFLLITLISMIKSVTPKVKTLRKIN